MGRNTAAGWAQKQMALSVKIGPGAAKSLSEPNDLANEAKQRRTDERYRAGEGSNETGLCGCARWDIPRINLVGGALD